MGKCASDPKNNTFRSSLSSSSLNIITKLKQEELELIRLMYDDLAFHNKDKVLNREDFDIFFHLNGLWGQEMFKAFNKSREGFINYEQFVSGIEMMVKGNFEQRSRLLFKFYDIERTGGVSYDELIKMLYSYPKQELREMITQQNFLKTIDNYQLLNFFNSSTKVDEMNVIEEVDQSEDKSEPERKHSEYVPSSIEFFQMQEKFLKEVDQLKKKKGEKFLLSDKTLKLASVISNQKKKSKRKSGSMLQTPTYFVKNFKLTNNIATLVKKYALYLFNEMKLDKNKDQINFHQFLKIVKNHQKIFTLYFQGFHSYIWMLEDDLKPEYLSITPFIQSACIKVYGDQKVERYLKYIKTTIFVFSRKKSKFPQEIKNMEGLIVEPKSNINGLGIIIKHRDGIYPEKEFYFESQAVQKEWLRVLSDYTQNSIYNKFLILEKIGTGNFSSVYRGVQKITEKQVAIKVIQKFKLTFHQKEVIKFEKGILELCHHPNIIRFYNEYNTKTRLYIVTQLMTEGDLFEYTKRSTFLEEHQAALIFKQLVEAMQYLNHQLGLIHRDLKPENVMIVLNKQKSGIHRVKIIDFGFAVYKSNLKNMSQREKFAGTPGFVAPQIFMGKQYDQSVDMFSLGIIMYFMLCGNLPFSSPIYEQIAELTKQCKINLNNLHWSNISNKAKDLLSKMLTFREKRISSSQVLDHPWLNDIEDLKKYNGKNKKNRYYG